MICDSFFCCIGISRNPRIAKKPAGSLLNIENGHFRKFSNKISRPGKELFQSAITSTEIGGFIVINNERGTLHICCDGKSYWFEKWYLFILFIRATKWLDTSGLISS